MIRLIPIPIPKNFIEEKITINRLGYTSNGTEKTRYNTQYDSFEDARAQI